MRKIKFKYVIKADDRIKISKSYALEEIDDIACMFETVVEDFNNYCTDIGHTSTTCDCFEDFWDKGEIVERIQYTGLKDKNGVEIYEGDIIENDFRNLFLIDYRYGASCVIHALSCRAEAEGECKFDYLYDFMKFYNIEVIGNIYENPELLNAI